MAAGLTAGRRLRRLHLPGRPLLLPNVWDADSARAVEAAGFPAVATSSAAVAEALGSHDGQVSAAEMFAAVAEVIAAVTVPVTADLERGYGLPAPALVQRMADAGAAGCNLEDSEGGGSRLVDAEQQAELLASIRQAAQESQLDLVINARIDTFLLADRSPTEQLAEAIRRARRYLESGADCVYPFPLGDLDAIRAFVERVNGPVNVLARPGGSTVAELAATGVARISFGPALRRLGRDRLDSALLAISAGASPF